MYSVFTCKYKIQYVKENLTELEKVLRKHETQINNYYVQIKTLSN